MLALALTAAAASMLVSPSVPIKPTMPMRPALASVRCCAPRDPDDIRARDLSSELAKYNTRGLRIRQSGPLRYGGDAVNGLVSNVRGVVFGVRDMATALPFHQNMMLVLLGCFGLQSRSPRAAMLAGARVNNAVNAGQWHRLFSPVFLHGGWMHLASNAFSMWRIGPLVEASFGAYRTCLLYLLSGVGGNVAGLIWGSAKGMSVGASGAVFGMIGATGGYVMRNSRALGRVGDMMLQNAFVILLINIFYGSAGTRAHAAARPPRACLSPA